MALSLFDFHLFELAVYILLSAWWVWRVKIILKHRPFWEARNAKNLLFCTGLGALVVRYWWLAITGLL